jgi:hypothetical protein
MYTKVHHKTQIEQHQPAPSKDRDDLQCSGRANNFCSTSFTRCVTLESYIMSVHATRHWRLSRSLEGAGWCCSICVLGSLHLYICLFILNIVLFVLQFTAADHPLALFTFQFPTLKPVH